MHGYLPIISMDTRYSITTDNHRIASPLTARMEPTENTTGIMAGRRRLYGCWSYVPNTHPNIHLLPPLRPLNTTQFFQPYTLTLWNTLMPPGTGLPAPDPTHTFFTTSMTHQLHCVYMMARIFSGVVLNATERIEEGVLPDDWHFHFMHCVDYMRQAVMCGADLAMEPHEPDDLEEGKLDALWGARHVCKDYGSVTKYLGEQINDGARVVLAIDD